MKACPIDTCPGLDRVCLMERVYFLLVLVGRMRIPFIIAPIFVRPTAQTRFHRAPLFWYLWSRFTVPRIFPFAASDLYQNVSDVQFFNFF